jgi:hypothetical protein
MATVTNAPQTTPSIVPSIPVAPPKTGGSTTNQPPPSGTGGGVSTDTGTPKPSTNVGAIAGGVVGGVVGLALIGGIAYLVWRKKQQRVAPLPEVSQLGTNR